MPVLGIDVRRSGATATLVDPAPAGGQPAPLGSTHAPGPAGPRGLARMVARLCGANDVPTSDITAVLIATDLAARALADPRALTPTAALRFASGPASPLPPYTGWPALLRTRCRSFAATYRGGAGYNGRARGPLDLEEVRRDVRLVLERGVRAFALSSSFGPLNPEIELAAQRVILDECPDAFVALSHEASGFSLQERENAGLLDAALSGPAARFAAAVEAQLQRAGFEAPLYVGQGDGSAAAVSVTLRHPASTLHGPQAAALSGAALATGLLDSVVIDLRGERPSVGSVVHARPRLSGSDGPRTAGVRASLPAPELLVPPPRRHGLLEAVHRMSGHNSAVPLVAITSPGRPLSGPYAADGEALQDRITQVSAHAAAYGIACAEASGEAIRVLPGDARGEAEVLASAHAEAVDRAIARGAEPAGCGTISEARMPLAYLPGRASRVSIRATGPVVGGPYGASYGEAS